MRWWAVCLLLLVCVFGHAQPAHAQTVMEQLITPGPLSRAHAALESRCDSCHQSFSREAQNARCLTCHRGIGSDVRLNQGFHGRSTARNQECRTCHSDHRGRGFALVQFTRASFNHALTDYPLAGAHVRATCAGCHGTSTHFRNAPSTCASCHRRDDPHLGRLGTNCQTCHQVTAWRTLLRFDHSRTGFQLTGAHRQQTCMSCHTGQRWNATPTQCIACHATDDRHRGSNGTECARCHNTTAWSAVSFNHSRDTEFPLLGRHASTSCAACHGANNQTRRPAKTCISCHANDDSHRGTRGTSCGNCHDATSWRNVRFDHSQTAFPLRGKHATTACTACHGTNREIIKPPLTCIGCHAADDSHRGSNGSDCARCHNVAGWTIATFDHDRMTGFPLNGAHRTATCESCHTPPEPPAKVSTTCASCHSEDDAHQGELGENCGSCHGNQSWIEGVRFDHALTRLPLIGKHATLECTQCHENKRFDAAGITCLSCHEDSRHNGSFGATPSCGSCHNSNAWTQWRFDHDTATSFPLTGRHIGLICSACHIRPGDPGAVATDCVSCHQRQDIHNGGFGNDCERCHVTTSFREIRLNRPPTPRPNR